MKKEIGGLFFLFLFLSGFVVAGSSSEINVTLIVFDDAVSDSVAESSVFFNFWEMYGTYIVVALILLIIFVLWRKGFSGSKKVVRKKRKK